ncbi:MAG: LysR family transcriptional regulator substrate-binding protein, partial [bacterium]
RKVTLTPAGKLFYARCQQILSLTEQTTAELKTIDKESLHIGISSSNTPFIYHTEISSFIRNRPHVNIRIKDGSTFEMIQALKSHSIDIGIVRTPFDSSDLQVVNIRKEPMIAVGEHIDPKQCHMKDYKDTPLIVHRRYRSFIANYCLNYLQFNPNIHVSSDDVRTAIFWAKSLSLVAVIPASSRTLITDQSLSYVALHDQELFTGISVITRKEELSPVCREFLEMLKKQL